jgi:cholesterol oxidase
MERNFWNPSEGLYGLFNVWGFGRLGAIVSSGLGGGSLIYANVLLRKDPRAFSNTDSARAGGRWPITYEQLEPHYTRVEHMLQARPYPFERPPYDRTRKTLAFRAAAQRAGLEPRLPNLAITFAGSDESPGALISEPEGERNLHGLPRFTCRLCGECDIGCNHGSKNTLDLTYLSRSQHLPVKADIRPLCEVRSFEPLGHRGADGYAIRYVRHDLAREGKRTNTATLDLHTITAKTLVLAAGTLGTTYLLLKNRSAFPHVSPLLGSRFCGNGDLVTFAVRCRTGARDQRAPLIVDAVRGPVITSSVHLRGAGAGAQEFYIQDGGYPEIVAWLLPLVLDPASLPVAAFRLGRQLFRGMLRDNPDTDVGVALSRLLSLGVSGLASSFLPLLGMGRDVPNGQLTLRDGKLDLHWRLGASDQYYHQVRRTMQGMASALGGQLRDPLRLLNRLVTVHPLGGCPMGENPATGVVNPYGEVFGYRNLYVADGSVMPGPVGANPSLTIAALADRFADRVIEYHREARVAESQ